MELDLCGVSPGAQTMSVPRKPDDVRIKNAAKKISEKYRKKRQKLRSEKKDKADKTSYQPGGFDLSAKPVNDTATKNKKKTPNLFFQKRSARVYENLAGK